MPPQGNLTPSQYEILDAIWQHGRGGASVREIWNLVSRGREVGRTTILNLVDRLEKRGWLRRAETDDGVRYAACLSRKQTESRLADEFVDQFFGGSTRHLVQSLLGSRKLNADEIDDLRALLAKSSEPTPSKKKKKRP